MTETESNGLQSCRRALRAAGISPAWTTNFFVPGRIEVLGKHTDYLGGRSLLAAVERGFTFVGVHLAEPEVRAIDAATGEETRFPLTAELETTPGHWSNYLRTVARRLTRDFPGSAGGCALAFASDLPPAAGLSSSSALITGSMLTLMSVLGIEGRPEFQAAVPFPHDLAEYAAAVESGAGYRGMPGDRGVGTHGGSEDHTAILCARADHMVGFSFAPLRWEREVPMPAGSCFVIASSGVLAEKTGAARDRYNRLSALGQRLLTIWNDATRPTVPTLDAALDTDPDAADRLRRFIAAMDPDEDRAALLARLDHFVAESREIIPAAVMALALDDLAGFGTLVDRSQDLAATLLENQIPETRFLASTAREAGALAASAFGAGFGGSVWALVPAATAPGFLDLWRDRYHARYPEHDDAEFFITAAGPPARRLL